MFAHRISMLFRSPFAAALLISASVAAGALLTSLGAPRVGTAPVAPDAQQRNAAAIARLESNVGAMSRDIDFIAERVGASVRRDEQQVSDRFVQMNATLAALNERLANPPGDRLVTASAAGKPVEPTLRPSMHELAAAQSAISAITKRLDRIEVKVGMSTDVVSSPEPVRHTARRKVHPVSKPAAESSDLLAQTERVLLNLRPAAKTGKTLRVSTLRD